LLTDEQGEPLSIEAFKGNTSNPATLKSQIEKIKEKYGCKKVALVGDKGMIKSAQIEDIKRSGLNYIITITKAQITSLIKSGVFQMKLFSDELVEIIDGEEKLRYILRRNPFRAEEIRLNQEEKIEAVRQKVEQSNQYLQKHPRAKTQVQERHLNDSIQKLKLDPILQAKTAQGERQIELSQNDEELGNASKLDGCYVIKPDLTEKKDKKGKIYSLYQSLASVEWAFRTEKSQLEICPIYLRKEHRTRGHLMVCMLSYKIEKYLRQCWKGLDIKVEEEMEKLSSIVGVKTLLGPTKEIL
jgi:transposase